MFREILISAGVAGLLAALVLTLLQALLIAPLILQAETYEEAATAAPHEHEQENNHASASSEASEHHHADDEWKPADGWQRTLFTLAANIVMGFGYALLLTGVYNIWRRPSGAIQGLLFGLAGFAVFFAAPGLGLPPELPGTAAAALIARQQWWIGTAAATALGLTLLFMQKNIALRGLGIIAIGAPHLLGAPHPAVAGSLAPESLQLHFRWLTTACNALFWLLLGVISALALRKFSSPPHSAT